MDTRRNRFRTQTAKRYSAISTISMLNTAFLVVFACLASVSQSLADFWKLDSYDMTNVLRDDVTVDSKEYDPDTINGASIDQSTVTLDSLTAYEAQNIVSNKMSGYFQFIDNEFLVSATDYEFLTFARLDENNATVRARYTNSASPNNYKGYVTFNLLKQSTGTESSTTTTTTTTTTGGSDGSGTDATCCQTTVKVFTKNIVNVTMPAINVAAPNVTLNAPDHSVVLNQIKDINLSIRDILRQQNNLDGNQTLASLSDIAPPTAPTIENQTYEDYTPDDLDFDIFQDDNPPSQGLQLSMETTDLADLNIGNQRIDFSNMAAYMSFYEMTDLKTILTGVFIFGIVMSFFFLSARILTA